MPLIIIIFFSCTLVALYSYFSGLGRGILESLAALGLAGVSCASPTRYNIPSFRCGILEGVACL
jgi:hypothetical protein